MAVPALAVAAIDKEVAVAVAVVVVVVIVAEVVVIVVVAVAAVAVVGPVAAVVMMVAIPPLPTASCQVTALWLDPEPARPGKERVWDGTKLCMFAVLTSAAEGRSPSTAPTKRDHSMV